MNKKAPINKQKKAQFDAICTQIASKLNLEFVESTWEIESRGFVITAFIDKPVGITLDDCEAFHKQLHKQVEHFDYDFLEVSSLGADRPIKSKKDFERFAGEVVEVKLFAKQNGLKEFIGNLTDYTDNYIQITTANDVLQFEHKDVALVKPFIDVETEVEDVIFDDEILEQGE